MVNFKSITARLMRFRARKPVAVGPVNIGWSRSGDEQEFSLCVTDHQGEEDGGKGFRYSLRIGPKEAVDFAVFVAQVITQQDRESGDPRGSFERRREPEEALRALADLIEKNGGNL